MHGAVQTISTLLMYGTMMPGSMLLHLIIDFVTTISFSINDSSYDELRGCGQSGYTLSLKPILKSWQL